MIFLRFCIAISIVFIIGCASFGERKQLDMLEQRTKNYETAIRWGRYDIAGAFVKSKVTTQVTDSHEELKQIKITSYKLLGRNFLENSEEAEQKVEIKFYNIDNLIEKTVIDNQIWLFNKDLKNWFLSTGLPVFK